MNRDETKKAIEVMQAYVDGAEPEQKSYSGNYGGPIDPQWNWDGHVNMYRIKPKPREFWISIEPPGETLVAWSVKPININGQLIKVCEVIE